MYVFAYDNNILVVFSVAINFKLISNIFNMRPTPIYISHDSDQLESWFATLVTVHYKYIFF